MQQTTKIILLVIIVLVLVVVGIWYGVRNKSGLTPEPAAREVIKIGVISALSGKYASYGEKMRKGIDLAIEDANKKLEKVRLEAIYEDTQADPTASVSAATKLIEIDNVKAILTIFSGVSGAVAPVAQEAKVPLFVLTLASDITDVGNFIFQPHALSSDEGIADANFLMDKGVQKVAILYGSSDSAVSMSESFDEAFKGEIVFSDMYQKGNQDFRTFIAKIKQVKPDWLYLPAYDVELGYILKQAREVSLDVPALSVQGVNSQALLDIAGEAAEGLIYSTAVLDPDKSDLLIADIFRRYQERHGEEINIYAGESYDAVMLFAEVVKDGAQDTEVIRSRLAATKNFKGVSGVITFDEKRHTAKRFDYFIVKNGQFVPYED